jgi:hypothetical protein
LFLKNLLMFICLLLNIRSYSYSSNSFLTVGLKQLENSFSFLLNNRKKQCEACNNIVQPNSGALPVHRLLVYFSPRQLFWQKYCIFLRIAFIYFDVHFSLLACGMFSSPGTAGFVLFCLFFCENVLSDTRHWMSSRVGSWMPSLMFQVISTLVLHSILENQKQYRSLQPN